MATGSSASLLSLVCFGELKRARSLGPVASAVLDELLEVYFGIGDFDDNAKVLPHVIANLDLVDILIRGAHQRERVLAALQRSDHLQRFQRIRLQRLLAPIEIRRELAATLDCLDLARLERIRQVEGVVRERLVWLHLRQGIELALDAFALLLHPDAQILVALAATAREKHSDASTDEQVPGH